MRDGRNKGARYMLAVCRELSHWMCKTDLKAPADELVFRPRSTALMPVDGHWKNAGDLVHRPSLRWPFCVECKCDEHGKIDSVLEAPLWPVWEWWGQTCDQAHRMDALPLLIFSRNHRANYAMLDVDTALSLELLPVDGPVLEIQRPPSCNPKPRRGASSVINWAPVTLCLLNDLKRIHPKVVSSL